jgi:hypothetical protein
MRLKAFELTLNTILRVLIVENIINKRGRMMALQQQIILEAPEFDNGRKSDNRPVDLLHLSKQTSGDRNLERNLLDMFAKQARESLGFMAGCSDIERGKMAGEIATSANSIGTFDVAEKAGRVEQDPSDAAALAGFTNAVVKASSFVASVNRI